MSVSAKHDAPTYMKVPEAAKYLGDVSEGWLYALVEKRQIPFVRLAGRRSIRFRKADLDAWMESHLSQTRAG